MMSKRTKSDTFNSSLKDTGLTVIEVTVGDLSFQFLIKGYTEKMVKRLEDMAQGDLSFQFLIKGYWPT